MHCSDEELLAHVDGELSPLARRRVRRHLESCWRCRTRLDAYQQEIRRLMVETDEWPFPPQGWNESAKRRLNASLNATETRIAKPERGLPLRRWVPVWSAAGIVAAAVVVAWYFSNPHLVPAPTASDVIAQASSAENKVYAQPVQQTFAIRIAEISPAHRAVDSRLQVWADRDDGRFAARLSEPGGTLKHALWRPHAGQEFVYRSSAASVVEQPQHHTEIVSLASLAENGMEPAQLEAAFMRWMESRPWTPISFTADASLWTSGDGSVAHSERLRGENGKQAIRLTVQRRARKIVAVLSLELDSNSYLPRLQTIRFETPDRTVEFRLEALSIQPVRHSDLSAVVFRPDPTLKAALTAGAPTAPRPGPAPELPSLQPSDQLPAWDEEEIQARYVLHQAGACLGESVRVSEETQGTSVLRRGSEGAYSSEARLETVLGALSELRTASPPESGAALRHAWALRQIAGAIRLRRRTGLSPSASSMIESIVRDHLAGIRTGLADLGSNRANASKPRPKTVDWTEATFSLFGTLTQLTETVRREPSDTSTARLIAEVYAQLDQIEKDFPSKMKSASKGVTVNR